jgi:hypothetical protein
MAFRSVSQKEFHTYSPYDAPSAASLAEENEWFADGQGDVIGVITRAPQWCITAFGRGVDNKFLAFDATANFTDVEEARQALFAQMEKVGTTPAPGRQTFQSVHVRERIVADRLLTAGLKPLEISMSPDLSSARVLFRRDADFVTIIGSGVTAEDVALDIVQQMLAPRPHQAPGSASGSGGA